MANVTTARRTTFGTKTIVAYAIGYLIAAVGVILGAALPSVPWLAFGIWLAASLSVLLIDRALGEKTPRPGTEENFGAIFQGSPAALTVIGVMAVVALLVALFVR